MEATTSTPTITVFMVEGGGSCSGALAPFAGSAEAAGCGVLKIINVATMTANRPDKDFIEEDNGKKNDTHGRQTQFHGA